MGARTLRRVVEYLSDLGVEELSVFALSVSNLQRDQEELNYLWELNCRFFSEAEGNDELWKKR